MDDDKFEKLMNEMREIQKAQQQADDKLSSSVKELRKEVNTAQEKTAKDLSQKITKSGYTFQRKAMNTSLRSIPECKNPSHWPAASRRSWQPTHQIRMPWPKLTPVWMRCEGLA